jgi:hypothetical protein
MTGWTSTQRLRRGWRIVRRELLGVARSVRYDPGCVERPGHARGRNGWELGGGDWPYRRLVTPVAFAMLLLGAVSGSYYAAAGGLFAGDRVPAGGPATSPSAMPGPSEHPSTATAPPVTVQQATPMPTGSSTGANATSSPRQPTMLDVPPSTPTDQCPHPHCPAGKPDASTDPSGTPTPSGDQSADSLPSSAR